MGKVIEGGVIRTDTGKPISLTRESKIINEDLKIIGEGGVSYQYAPPPIPTHKYYQPHRLGRENLQASGLWAGNQGQQGIIWNSVRKETAERRVTTGDG